VAAFALPANAQQPLPTTISPLTVESDPNGVNLPTGKTAMLLPVLTVPGAPNLRFDRPQNAAPYVVGKIGGTESIEANYSMHTLTGTSESFRCPDYDCESITRNGSSYVPQTGEFTRGGTGEVYLFDRLSVSAGSNPLTTIHYASSVRYPNGEVISFTYDTASYPGDTRIFHRPTQISSNLGYFILIWYHPGDLGSGFWDAPSQAAIYHVSAPTAPLASFTYSSDRTTITDHSGRVFVCTGCIGGLSTSVETAVGTRRLPGETSDYLQVSSTVTPVAPLIGAVTVDGVQWNYSYTNVRPSTQPGAPYFDRVTVIGPNGYNVAYAMNNWDGGNVISQITDSLGRVTTVSYDSARRPTRIAAPEGNAVEIVYDSLGNIVSRTLQPKPGSGLSPVTERAGYPGGTCSSGLNGVYGVTCFRPVWHRDGLDRQTDFQYNDRGQLTERTDPADSFGVRRKTIITYAVIDGLSRVALVRECGDTTTCGTANEVRTQYAYWGNTFLPSLVRRSDFARTDVLETRYTYDLAGRVLVENGPIQGTADTKHVRYDSLGRKSWEIGHADPQGNRLATRFWPRPSDDKIIASEQGWVPNESSTTLLDARRVDITYDSRRNPERESVSAAGVTRFVTQRDYDNRGRLVCEAVRMNENAFGALPGSACALGAPGANGPDRITRNFHDAAGQLLQVQRAYGTPLQQNYVTYTYTPNGKQQTIRDANDNLSTLEYDGFDRLATMRFPVATTGANQSSATDYEQYGYDPLGNRTSLRKRDGKLITFTHDALNRVRTKFVPGSTTGAPGYDVYYRFTEHGQQWYARFGSDSGAGVTNTYDAFGRLRTSTTNLDGTDRTVAWDYFRGQNRRRLTHPDGTYFEYVHDAADRLIHLSENGPSTTLASILYDALGRRTGIQRDTAGAVTGFGYDPVSRLVALTQDLDGTGSANDLSTTFAYNPANQIVTRSQSNDAYEFPVPSLNRGYAANGRNQYTQVAGATMRWDANGNLTGNGTTGINFSYDTENRLVGASGAKTVTLSYDPLGRLHQVTSGGETTRFLYEGDRLIAEYNASGTLLRRYVHGAGVDEPLVWYEGSGVSAANRRYLHANHQGSIVARSAPSGTTQQISVYDAYGVTTSANTGRFQYTGQAAIPELGLYHYKARVYDPSLGRFLQTDPIGYADDQNLYGYVRNDPLNKTDPTGLEAAGWSLYGSAYRPCDNCSLDFVVGSAPGMGAAEAYDQISAGKYFAGAIALATELPFGKALRGVVYRVLGKYTSSGKNYIGKTDTGDPKTRRADGGRVRNDETEIVDRYDPDSPGEGSFREQKALDAEGGVAATDNRRREVSEARMKTLEQTYGKPDDGKVKCFGSRVERAKGSC
jgi:RHS repeat-associated protein